jgi:ribosomal-protein-serine acetyltransferase
MMLSHGLDELGVRPLEAVDAEELQALIEANRDHLARWMPWAAEQDLAGTERFVAEAEDQLMRENGFQAKVEPEGEMVGVVGVDKIDWANRSTGLGYWLAADAQGRGTMTTVVREVLDYAFYEWELHRVEIRCAPQNRRSRAIPERLGFREEGRLREAELVGDRYLDSVVYGMLGGDWGRISHPT